MSISDVTENAILALVYNATTWANYAINASASPEANIVVALHTADPNPGDPETGTMSTSEVLASGGYTGYVRQNVVRTTSGWTAPSAGATNLVANLDFPASNGASTTITHFSTGKSGGGASAILWSGAVSPTIAIGAGGVIPRLTTATSITLA